MYYLGQRIDRGVAKDIEWLTKSAAKHYVSVEVDLSFIYEMSKYDYNKAIQWYAVAAESNNP